MNLVDDQDPDDALDCLEVSLLTEYFLTMWDGDFNREEEISRRFLEEEDNPWEREKEEILSLEG